MKSSYNKRNIDDNAFFHNICRIGTQNYSKKIGNYFQEIDFVNGVNICTSKNFSDPPFGGALYKGLIQGGP